MFTFEEMASTYPLMRGGGLFLMAVGLGILVGASGGRRWFVPALIAGAALGVVAMAVGGITKWIFAGLPHPSWWHWAVLGAAFLLEGFLVSQVVERLQFGTREFWLWMLLIVGVHFLVLIFSHGPICGLLGLACIVNAAIGLSTPGLSVRTLWGFDGVLKVAAGAVMVLASFPRGSVPV